MWITYKIGGSFLIADPTNSGLVTLRILISAGQMIFLNSEFRLIIAGTGGRPLPLYVRPSRRFLVNDVAVAAHGSSGQGCLGYLPRISARTCE